MLDLIIEKVNPEEIQKYKERFNEQMDRVPTDVNTDMDDENDVSSAIHNWLVELEQMLNKYL